MKRKLLAVLITAIFAAPAVYAQGTTPPKDTGMTKDRPAASSSKGDAMKSDKGTAASAKGQARSDAKKDGSPDAVITSKIKTGFIKDKIVRSRNYNVDTSGGVVTVKGKARSQAEADRAMEIAKSTQGVSSVKNEIQVVASADKPKRDTRAAAGTTAREPSDPVAKGDATKAGAATGAAAGSTRGTSAKGSTSASASKEGGSPDALITTKIKAEHAKDKDVSATKISVDTTNGVVTLGGTAKSKAEADKAVMLAKNVKGVTSVKNNIKVGAAPK
jgi:osmotically-inducible protein OsmY